jgi:hypothetical protein
MIAARRGKADVLRLLIDRGAVLDQTAKFGFSAAMLAVINGHVEIVRMLVLAGARLDIRGTGAPGFSGKTAVDLAAERGEPAMTEALRGATSTSSPYTWHWSAGQDAIRGGSVRRVPEVPEDRRGLPRGQPRCVEGGSRRSRRRAEWPDATDNRTLSGVRDLSQPAPLHPNPSRR